jgi:hypothetical protein
VLALPGSGHRARGELPPVVGAPVDACADVAAATLPRVRVEELSADLTVSKLRRAAMRAWYVAARVAPTGRRHRPCRSLHRHALSQLWRQRSGKKVKEVILIGPDLHQDHVIEAGVDEFADGLQMPIG